MQFLPLFLWVLHSYCHTLTTISVQFLKNPIHTSDWVFRQSLVCIGFGTLFILLIHKGSFINLSCFVPRFGFEGVMFGGSAEGAASSVPAGVRE